jgi:hypothetical protein
LIEAHRRRRYLSSIGGDFGIGDVLADHAQRLGIGAHGSFDHGNGVAHGVLSPSL